MMSVMRHRPARRAARPCKLSGMLDTLDARLAQAHGGDLGHLDFLQVLCQDEITRRETVAFQRRLHRASFEQQVTLEDFDFTANLETPRRPDPRPRRPALARTPASPSSCYGPVGVGKTHVAQALGHLAVRHGADVRFAKTSRLLADLAGGHADRTWDQRLRELVTARRAHPRRLRDARAHRRPGRRPLRTGLRARKAGR